MTNYCVYGGECKLISQGVVGGCHEQGAHYSACQARVIGRTGLSLHEHAPRLALSSPRRGKQREKERERERRDAHGSAAEGYQDT